MAHKRRRNRKVGGAEVFAKQAARQGLEIERDLKLMIKDAHSLIGQINLASNKARGAQQDWLEDAVKATYSGTKNLNAALERFKTTVNYLGRAIRG